MAARRGRAPNLTKASSRTRGGPVPPPAQGVRRVDIGRWFRQELFLGALLPTALGASALVGAIVGATTDGGAVATRVVLGVLSVPFLGAGAGLYIWLFRFTPQSFLDIDGRGLAERGRKGVARTLGWQDIESLSLVRSRARTKSRVRANGTYLAVYLPRHFLRLRVSAETARARPELELAEALSARPRKQRDAPIDFLINLGIPPSTAHEVLDALGSRLVPPQIVRERKGELAQDLY